MVNKLQSIENIILATKIELIKCILFGVPDEAVRAKALEKAEIIMAGTATTEEDIFKAADLMKEQVSWQQTMMIFNPNYPQSKNEYLSQQARALENLGRFIQDLKKCTELKGKIREDEKIMNKITESFL